MTVLLEIIEAFEHLIDLISKIFKFFTKTKK